MRVLLRELMRAMPTSQSTVDPVQHSTNANVFMNELEIIVDGSKVMPPPLPGNHGKPLVPVPAEARIVSLDVLRGFSLLGILVVNMLSFSQPLEALGFRNGLWLSPADKIVDWISVLLVEGKFYPIFSFLFGLGFSMQMDRAGLRGLDFLPVYRRRLFVLMVFGIAHGIFLWEGDVLLPYALCGFLLLLFRNRKPVTIAVWAVVLILLPALLMLLIGLVFLVFSGNAGFSEVMQDTFAEDPEVRSKLVAAFVTGGYADTVSYRLGEFLLIASLTLIFAPAFLGLFLIGLLVGRTQIIMEAAQNRRLIVRLLAGCGVVGLVGNFFGAWAMMVGSAGADFGLVMIGTSAISVFGPVLAAAYVAGILLLIQREGSFGFLFPVASVGRMALTNYLAQSAIATTIFYGYGFGLGGSIGRLGTIGMALAIFAAQVLFSVIWLKFFRCGPMEWLWRSLTCGNRQPMRR